MLLWDSSCCKLKVPLTGGRARLLSLDKERSGPRPQFSAVAPE